MVRMKQVIAYALVSALLMAVGIQAMNNLEGNLRRAFPETGLTGTTSMVRSVYHNSYPEYRRLLGL